MRWLAWALAATQPTCPGRSGQGACVSQVIPCIHPMIGVGGIAPNHSIEETTQRPDPALDDQRRRYYRLTSLGRQVAAADMQRLTALFKRASSRGWHRIPHPAHDSP